jgi:hypothetical protein
MNEESTRMGEAELRMALRGLRQDIEPGRDLWPGIAARLEALPRQPARAGHASRPGWLWPVATAATVLLAVGVAWQFKPAEPAMATGQGLAQTATASASRATLVQREAEGLTVQYHAAMREIAPQPVPAGWQPGLDALDRSALEIRGALQHDPDSRLLLQRLRDTYTRRLALARRALYT